MVFICLDNLQSSLLIDQFMLGGQYCEGSVLILDIVRNQSKMGVESISDFA